MKKLFYSSIILTLFIPLFLCGCGENYSLNKDKDKPDKVVLIGIDGATWKIILPLIREGKLPHMAELMREGSWGVLSSEDPLRSPVLWTTIATGKSFRQHGIINVAKQEAGSPKYTYYTSKDRKAKAFWNILTDYGISSGVVEWWASWPAEKINGYIVSDYFRFASPPFEAFKKDFSVTDMVYPEPIFKIVEKYKNITTIPEEFSYPEEKGMTLDEAEEFTREAGENDIDARKIRKMILINNVRTCSKDDLRTFFTGQNLLKAFPTDLFAIYFQRVDSICHSFWEFFEPDKNCNLHTSREEIRLFREIIPKYYEWQDSLIGNLLLNLDKKNTTVMIVSDHGFKRYCNPSPHSFNMNYLFEKLGWLKLKDRNILWSETVAYQPLGLRDSYHPICLNLKGRDPQGIVTIEEYENWREKIKERLSALETENGKKLFEEIVLVENPHEKNIDLNFKLNNLLSPEDKITIDGFNLSLKKFLMPDFQSGFHEYEGIIIISGNHIKKGRVIKGATVKDITPTILALYGIPVGKDMDGKALTDALEEGFLAKKPVTFVASHDLPSESPKKTVKDQAMDEGFREKLKSIGYLQ